jgi:UDP-glucose 4-epimerase
VQDLCDAHLLALEALLAGGASARYNLGNGNGYSIREVIAAAQRVCGRGIGQQNGPRRAGDPARLVADPSLARAQLGWQPVFADLDTIIAHAWAWEQRYHRQPARLRAIEAGGDDRRQRERRLGARTVAQATQHS